MPILAHAGLQVTKGGTSASVKRSAAEIKNNLSVITFLSQLRDKIFQQIE